MNPLCVIPARRGSKRLPHKNILPLAGKPMVTYSIEAALASQVFDRVFVSTEDDEIATIAERAGAIAHRRPAELAGDLVSATDVCLEVADSLSAIGADHDAIVCLQPTSPLRTATDVKESWERMLTTGADYLVSVTPIDPHYFHWAVHQQDTGWRMFFGDRFLVERPLLPPVYRPNGAIKIGKTEKLRRTRNFFGDRLEVHAMPEERAVHIATQFDFDLAEHLLGCRPHR